MIANNVMPRLILLVLALLFMSRAYTQNRYDANWTFGVKGGIHFDKFNTRQVFETNSNSVEATGTFSDSDGNLLLYIGESDADGNDFLEIFDSNDTSIYDSIRLNGSITNGVAFLPFSGDVLMLHLSNGSSSNCPSPSQGCVLLYYSVLDISGADITFLQRNVLVNTLGINEKICIIKNAQNDGGWWVINQESIRNGTGCSDEYYVTQFLPGKTPLTKRIPNLYPYCNVQSNLGEMAASRDGNWIATGNAEGYELFLSNFDRCTGNIYNQIKIELLHGAPYGLAFSPSGQFLYVGTGASSGCFCIDQYDISDTSNITRTRIAQLVRGDDCIPGQFELGPDGKLYLAAYCTPVNPVGDSLSRYMHYIEFPDSPGIACGFRPYSIYLGPNSRSTLGLPHFPNYNLGPTSIYQANAGPDTIFICKELDTIKTVYIGDSIAVQGVSYYWEGKDISGDTASRVLVSADSLATYFLTLTDTSIKYSCQTRVDTLVIVPNYDCPTSIREVVSEDIKVYPNPTSGQLFVKVNQPTKLELYDLNGRQVNAYQLEQGENTIQIQSLQNGVYIYKIWVGGELIVTNKLVRY